MREELLDSLEQGNIHLAICLDIIQGYSVAEAIFRVYDYFLAQRTNSRSRYILGHCSMIIDHFMLEIYGLKVIITPDNWITTHYAGFSQTERLEVMVPNNGRIDCYTFKGRLKLDFNTLESNVIMRVGLTGKLDTLVELEQNRAKNLPAIINVHPVMGDLHIMPILGDKNRI